MKSQWSSRFAFIMATTGAAVGLGNIWKFPYMAGENGGGLFVLFYLLAVLLIGIPSMMAEILIGRLGGQNPVNTLKTLALQAGKSPHWQLLGWWGAFGLVLILSFYSVVAGWSVGYLIKAWSGEFNGLAAHDIQEIWKTFLSNPWNLLIWHTLFMTLTLWVVARGVKEGLERATKIMMPGLFLVLLILTLYSAWVGDFQSALDFLLKPDLKEISPQSIIYALGHAFFTLAIGAGAMLVYGTYLPKNTRLGSSVFIIAALDIMVALFSGLAIFSLVFKYQLPPEGGPGLMFKVLPIIFAQMPGGQWFGGLFFLLLWFAAWASSISMAEPLVVLLVEKKGLSRRRASLYVGAVCWLLGIGALFSFNIWDKVLLFGKFTIFDAMADFATNIVLPIGGFLFALFSGWVLIPEKAQQGLLLANKSLFKLWHFIVRYIAPAAILLIFFLNLS